jgi:hypothetical protein
MQIITMMEEVVIMVVVVIMEEVAIMVLVEADGDE